MVDTATGSTVVSFGSAIRAGGENVRLVAPPERVAAGIAALKAWRTALAKQEGKPPYVYLSDAHITDIAERDPDTARPPRPLQGHRPRQAGVLRRNASWPCSTSSKSEARHVD